MKNKPVEFILGDGRRETIPRAIAEINSDCNFACPGCYMIQEGKTSGDGLMLPEDVEKILATLRPESLDILGGEPLKSPYFRDIVDVCVSYGVLPWVFSNLSLADEEMADFLMKRGAYVTGKLNIGNPKDPEQLRLQARMIGKNGNAVRDMLAGIRTMKKTGYKRPELSIENLLRKDNISLAPDYVRWCLENDIEPDLELPACANPGSKRDYFEKIAPSAAEIRRLIPELKKIYAKFGIDDPNFPPHISGKGVCKFKDQGLYFSKTADGIRMQPCSSNTENLGFLDGYDSVVKALEKPVMVARRTLNKLYNDGKIEGFCGDCEYFVDFCKGGCRATAENVGNPKSSYTLCWINGGLE